jgi:hypothetical protein
MENKEICKNEFQENSYPKVEEILPKVKKENEMDLTEIGLEENDFSLKNGFLEISYTPKHESEKNISSEKIVPKKEFVNVFIEKEISEKKENSKKDFFKDTDWRNIPWSKNPYNNKYLAINLQNEIMDFYNFILPTSKERELQSVFVVDVIDFLKKEFKIDAQVYGSYFHVNLYTYK